METPRSHRRNWWTCPTCGHYLGELVEGNLVVNYGTTHDVAKHGGYRLEMLIPVRSGIKRRCNNRTCRALPHEGWVTLEAA